MGAPFFGQPCSESSITRGELGLTRGIDGPRGFQRRLPTGHGTQFDLEVQRADSGTHSQTFKARSVCAFKDRRVHGFERQAVAYSNSETRFAPPPACTRRIPIKIPGASISGRGWRTSKISIGPEPSAARGNRNHRSPGRAPIRRDHCAHAPAFASVPLTTSTAVVAEGRDGSVLKASCGATGRRLTPQP